MSTDVQTPFPATPLVPPKTPSRGNSGVRKASPLGNQTNDKYDNNNKHDNYNDNDNRNNNMNINATNNRNDNDNNDNPRDRPRGAAQSESARIYI